MRYKRQLSFVKVVQKWVIVNLVELEATKLGNEVTRGFEDLVLLFSIGSKLSIRTGLNGGSSRSILGLSNGIFKHGHNAWNGSFEVGRSLLIAKRINEAFDVLEEDVEAVLCDGITGGVNSRGWGLVQIGSVLIAV